jgi:hypothetical protein
VLAKLIDKLRIRLLRRNEYESLPLRRYYATRWQVEIGLYSSGCLDPWRMPARTRIGGYCSIAKTARILDANHPMTALTTHPYSLRSKIQGGAKGSHRFALAGHRRPRLDQSQCDADTRLQARWTWRHYRRRCRHYPVCPGLYGDRRPTGKKSFATASMPKQSPTSRRHAGGRWTRMPSAPW